MRFESARRWPAVPRWALLIVAAHVALVALATSISRTHGGGVPALCAFRRITHHPCPGCGTTRMVLAAGGGNWRQAAAYNPLAFGLLVVGLGLLGVRVLFRRRVVWITSVFSRRLLTVVLILAVLANWLYLLAVSP